MAAKKKKIKAAGRFGAGYGTNVRSRFNDIESQQRKAQKCPIHENCTAKRVAVGIWECKKGAKFAGNAYYLSAKK